jgi:hypothetical protein
MNDDPQDDSVYQVSSNLLATKGRAEPLTKSAISLILANEKQAAPTDDQCLTDAVIDSTLDLLTREPGTGKPKAAASLTDLLDPNLINAVRRS